VSFRRNPIAGSCGTFVAVFLYGAKSDCWRQSWRIGVYTEESWVSKAMLHRHLEGGGNFRTAGIGSLAFYLNEFGDPQINPGVD